MTDVTSGHVTDVTSGHMTDVTSGHATHVTSGHVTSDSTTAQHHANVTWAVPIYYSLQCIDTICFQVFKYIRPYMENTGTRFMAG
jgi:hypothetical protein